MSSMFGQSKPTTNIFANIGSTSQSQTAPASSQFGANNITNLQSRNISGNFSGTTLGGNGKTNPFLSFGTSQSQQQQMSTTSGGGLFGLAQSATSQPQQVTSSLSEARKPTATSGQATSSLLAPHQPQEQQNQAQQQDDQQGLLIKKSAQPAYFENLLENGRKRTRDTDGGPGFKDLPSLQLGLGDIAKRVRELGGAGSQKEGSRGADSRAHYLLAASGVNPGNTRRDLDSLAAEQSIAGAFQQPPNWEPATHNYVDQLQQRSTLNMINDGLERAHRNFDAYLEENVDINWNLQRKKIYEHFGLIPTGDDTSDDLSSSSNERGSFGKSTRKGEQGKGSQSAQSTLSRSIFGHSSLQKSVIGTPGVDSANATLFADVAEKTPTGPSALDDRFLREKQRRFAEKVQGLNRYRLQKARVRDARLQESYPVLMEFSGVEYQVGGESPKQLADSYQALIEIIGEGKAIERQFADEYLDENPNSAKSVKIRRHIIDGSRRSLEKAFFEQLEALVVKNPKEAKIGGVPTAINKVRAYIRIRAARKDLIPDGAELSTVNEDYYWALIFFLLRSGLIKEAADYVLSIATPLKSIDRNFITYITEYASSLDRRLGRQTQTRCNTEYHKQTHVAPEFQVDPYRIACYKVIGRCELSKRSIDSISQRVEDWIWLQFNLAREVNRVEESAGDVFGLEEVRETIREIGQRHFAKGAEGLGGYGTFFHLQILGGMFEQAVAYLYPYSYVAAVHFAVALDFYGLLRVSDFSVTEAELLTYNTKELPQISFGRMIGYYTRDFRAGNVEAAVDYITLICLSADLPGQMGKSQSSLCHEALRELVLETREFSRLLGDICSDGTRLKGAIEDRLELIRLDNQEEFLKTVTIQAASVADNNGRTTDAVLLYHLAEDYDNVVSIINRALSEAIAVEIGQEQMRLQPLKPRTVTQQEQELTEQPPNSTSLSLTSVGDPVTLARNMISLYNNNTMYFQKIRPANRDACGMLLRMTEAKAKVVSRHWSEAIDIIDSLQLLPLSAHASIPTIRASATAFNALPPTISRNVGPLLLWTITCIGRQREVLGSRQFGGGQGDTNRAISDELLGSARDLMVFAGLVKYRLGERVWEAVCGVGGDVGVY